MKNAELASLEAISDATAASGLVERLDGLKVEDFAPTKFDLPEPPRYPTVGVNQLTNEILDAVNTSTADEQATSFTGTRETEDELYASVKLTATGISSCTVGLPWGMDPSAESIAALVSEAYADAFNARWTAAASGGNPLESLANDAIQLLAAMQVDQPGRAQ
ncbi:hypothetical protein BOX37_22560 [Nocardia mangyaensis]|uniref:Uncharacterized protein n=1 Tax=Nocardia mangyaensis TaxID=2213200 RepID=A0A1J0VW53_9NOCA|nr:hypothetical protein [Nocardia mangyaensis]APE36245.1 hypothetical protein BOX37_22560 [Nocardia mangyaensis]